MANKFNDIVSMSPRYKYMCKFDNTGEYDKFMYLIDLTHFEDGSGRYSNHFFYASANYHRNWKTAKEINEMVEAFNGDEDDYTPKYTYTGATLGKYVRMGLMEVSKGKPNLYTLPIDFFTTNDLRISFRD